MWSGRSLRDSKDILQSHSLSFFTVTVEKFRIKCMQIGGIKVTKHHKHIGFVQQYDFWLFYGTFSSMCATLWMSEQEQEQ